MKRVFDLTFAMVLFVLLLPVLAGLALLIRLKMGAPVLFRQVRPGLQGNLFTIYKFRTMNNQTDENGVLLQDDSRLTSLGKTLRKLSLDELPQLLNVLKGDMSFVGPRPLMVEYLPLYSAEQARRHAVKPGITGWAQVNGRNAISWEEKFKLDVWYVDHQSLLLDSKILILTVLRVVKAQDIDPDRTRAGAGPFRGCIPGS